MIFVKPIPGVCTCLERYFAIDPDLGPGEPCEVVDAECERVAVCANSAIAQRLVDALNMLNETEIVRLSNCMFRGDDLHRNAR